MASVRYEQLVKNFGVVRVIKGLDLEVRDGELVVFVGPSGCGKTTLLRLIGGLEEVTEGTLYIGDRAVNDIPPKQRNVSMVFQNYALFPHMTVAQNIAFGLKMRGASKSEQETAVSRVAEILGLTELLERRPRQLSGGQRQRVAMGRAIVRNPDVYLMDEPLSNLDAELRSQMRVEIKQLQRRLRTTMIFVTHDQVEAMTLADRIAVLRDGELQQYGTPDELYTKPVNRFIGGFIGSPAMNFFSTKRVSEGELELPGGLRMKLPADRAALLGEAGTLEVGVRPEHVRFSSDADGTNGGTLVWTTSADVCEPLGGSTVVHASLGDTSMMLVAARNDGVSEGSAVRLAFDVSHAHIFRAEDGECVSHATKV